MVDVVAPRPALGLIVPSSNRMVERVATAMLAEHPGVDGCIARVPYSGIVAADGTRYLVEPFDAAATLLADAGVAVICWNATRGAMLGFDEDRALCARIARRTGIPMVTTALASLDLVLARPDRRVGLLTQGDERESADLVQRFREQGVVIAGHDWLGIADNLAAASVPAEKLLHRARSLAARASLDDVLVWSTNLAGFQAKRCGGLNPGFSILDSAEIGLAAAMAAIEANRQMA